MPALKALLFRGGASNNVLTYEICELSKMLSKIVVAIGMHPDLMSDTASRLLIYFFFFYFSCKIGKNHLNKSEWLSWKSCLLKVIAESSSSDGQADGVSFVSLSSSVPKQP